MNEKLRARHVLRRLSPRQRFACAALTILATTVIVPACSNGGPEGPGAPSQLAPNSASTSGVVGTAVATPPSVIVKDAKGQAVSGVSIIFAVTAGGGSVSGGSTISNAQGIATAGGWTLGTTAGNNVVTASSSAIAGVNVTFSATATAGPASRAVSNGGSATGTAGAPIAVPPSVLVTDAFNNPVSGVTVTFSVTSGGGNVAGGVQTTNASGIASLSSWTMGTAVGVNTLSAVASGIATPVTFTSTATAGAAASIALNGGSTSANAGTALAIAPSVLVRDAFNNPVNNAAVTFTVTSGGGSVIGANQTTNASGIATVGSWTLGPVAGTNTLSAAVAGVATPTVFTATGIAVGPDYIVTAMSAPTTGVIGSNFTLSATLRNQGNAAGGAFRVGFYFSSDANITSADIFSGYGCYFDPGLPANTQVDCTGPIVVPSSLPAGTYFVGAIVDDQGEVAESNETNNTRAAATSSLLTLPLRADLVVDVVTAPGSSAPGGVVALTGTVRNSGTLAAPVFRTGVYISTDQTITTTDRELGSCTFTNGLNAGATADCGGNVTLPTDLASGTYYIGFIADDQGVVTELSETNNSRASGAIVLTAVAKPDLVVETMTAPATGTVNGSISISSRVRNNGTAAGPFRLAFYYSTDANITTADVFSGSVCNYPDGLAANTFDDCTGFIPVPAGLAPGTYYVGAIADDEGLVNESNENNNTRASATTIVITGGGTTLDLFIDGMYITQATQTYTGTVPLVVGRGALMRVFVRANQANTLAPTVRARFYINGTLFDTKTIAAPSAGVPTTIDQSNLGSSWNLDVSQYMQAGLSVLVDVDPTSAIVESNEGNNAFPLNGTPKAMDMRTVNVYNATLVPVVQVPNGLRGDVTEANKNTYTDFTGRVYPLSGINTLVHANYNFSQAVASSYDNTWTTLLSEINALRTTEGIARRYYGVLKPAYAFGGTGLGYIDGNAAIGVDWTSPVTGSNTTLRSMTAAHEWGHNFGRQHVNCGDPAGPDPNYPYTPNSIGVYGFDITRNAQLGTNFADLMTYCTPLWISDYTYKAVLSYRASHPQSISAGASRRGLLVWGHIGPDGVVLEPAFEIDAPPSLPERTGPYRVKATDANGQDLFNISFDGQAIDHVDGVRQFAFVVPLPSPAARASSVQLSANGRNALQRGVSPSLRAIGASAVAGSVRLRSGIGRRATLEWNSAEFPMVLVRDPITREVLSFARGGRLELDVPGSNLELVMSDGAGSVTLTVSKTP